MNILVGMKILWIFYAFPGLFLRPRYRMGDIFGLPKLKNMGMLENLDIFGDER